MFTAFGGAHDLVIAGTRDSQADNVLYGLALADGSVSWTFDNGGGAGAIGVITGDPSLDYATRRVYFTSREHGSGSQATVWCVEFTDTAATLVWSRQIGDVDGSPILHAGRLYVGTNTGELHALDPATGADLWAAPFATADGAIKGYPWPRFGQSPTVLVFSTTDTVWSIQDDGAAASLRWSTTAVPSPSIPMAAFGSPHVWVGGGDGALHQLDVSTVPPVVTSVVLGDGSAAVGSPSYSFADALLYAGSESGRLYALDVPLP